MDQFVMAGGKALFCIDAIEVRKDSLGLQGLPYQLNLTDFFFNYGVRINENSIRDLSSAPVRVNTGSEYKLMPWSFHPLISNFGDHVITKGFDGAAIYMRYINTIDTIKTQTAIKKTPLMFTSNYTRVQPQPVFYSVDELRIIMDKRYYPHQHLPVAYVLEGEFKSLFKGRNLPEGVEVGGKKDFGKSAIVVVSDGDLLIPEVQESTGKPYPLGFHPLSQRTYMNKTFVKNTMDYLLGEKSISNLRAKQVDFRPLDKFRIKEEKLKWQIINILIPILLVILFGIIRYYLRKKKYASF
jgi:gliding-associated putative ABC transporter substrate-binding component GldG